MKELLQEWSELEPEPSTFNWDDAIQWIEYPIESVSLYPEVRSIQLAVQQAIEDKGWLWSLSKTIDFMLPIDRVPGSESSMRYLMSIRDKNIRLLGEQMKDSPAHALLSAYLEAIKATKTEEVAG